MPSVTPFIPAWDAYAEPNPCRISANQVRLMEAYIEGRISANTCAASLTKPVEDASAQGAEIMNDAVFAINSFIHGSAPRNFLYQPQILALVKAIQSLPPVKVPTPKVDEDGGPISLGDEGNKLWEDMPSFGHDFGDIMRARQADFYDNYNSSDIQKAATVAAEWAGANAWAAQLVSLNDPRIASDFFLYFASYSISHALEREEHPMFAQELPAAAMVFRYAAPALLRLCRERAQTDAEYALYDFEDVPQLKGQSRQSLWTGSGGYSPERWAFWKSKWQALSDASTQAAWIQDHANAAIKAMEATEKGLPV
ncbi:hypothetical protein HD806DRAFT_501498 [Xylariaceae sp. AK1471]|nr:hypothetical protein HD806DRAFT_501498 [Xylariaceae sp. AK1471]